MSTDNGVLIGVVSDLNDPLELGRIKVTLAAKDAVMSNWAHVVSPMAGPNRGALFRPEIGDTVLLAAEMGDIDRLYVLGGVWSMKAPPPAAAAPNAKNDVRAIVSRSGHVLTFDDTPGKERLDITDKSGNRSFSIDCAEGRVAVTARNAHDKIEVTAPAGTVTVKAAKDVAIETDDGAINISAPNGTLTLKGARIKLEAHLIEIDGGEVKVVEQFLAAVTGGLAKID